MRTHVSIGGAAVEQVTRGGVVSLWRAGNVERNLSGVMLRWWDDNRPESEGESPLSAVLRLLYWFCPESVDT